MSRSERKMVALAKRHMWTVREKTFFHNEKLAYHVEVGPVKEIGNEYLSAKATSITQCYTDLYEALEGILHHNRTVYSPNSTTINTGPK